ncbi:hypothetical protein BDQ12DRAFT_729389 [Crucibulum laeve]|uniref:Uncharacterized protein n=1 Tax=Crucibulum laeve TaxID=68775 RepID=A0A5C3LFN9_9AGAR|nr:hypothetical protein BDQ12DRAFT_729389 [Crucibulum laeve]
MSGCESRKAGASSMPFKRKTLRLKKRYDIGPPRRESLSLPPILHPQDMAAATRSPSGDERARSSSPRHGEVRDGGRESTQCTLPSFQEVVRSVDRPQENSHLSPHWQRILNPTPPPRTYSTYRTTKATFTWPNLQLASQMEGRSIIYADYSTPPPEHYPGETSTYNDVYSQREFTLSPPAVQGLPKRTPPKEHVYAGVFSTTTPFLNVERRRRETLRKGTPSSIIAQAQSPVGSNSLLEDSDDDDVDSASEATTPARASNWEDHTRICTNSNGEVQYECLWPLSYRAPGLCGYKRKKQLVKRHVESTHLNIR